MPLSPEQERIERVAALVRGAHDGRQLGTLLPHARPEVAQLVVEAGKRGMGKTTGAEAYLETREPRVLVVTPHRDYLGMRAAPSLDEALADLQDAGPCRRRVEFPPDADPYEWGQEVFASCYAYLENALLVLAECHLLSPISASKELIALVTQGRHRGIRMFCDTQRIGLVPGIMLSEATQLVAFRVTRPRDLDVIEEWTDADVAAAVPSLAVGRCLVLEL